MDAASPAFDLADSRADQPCPLRVRVIFNPTAGRRRRRLLDRVVSGLRAAGADVELRATTRAGDAVDFAAEARRSHAAMLGPDVLVAAGGDGTINEAINGLAGGDLPLAILPLGTANVLAAEIGLERRADAVVRAVLSGRPTPIHLGTANGRRFALMAGVGLDAEVVATVDPALKRATGKLAYAVATWLRWREYPHRSFRLLVDGVEMEAAAAVIANGHYYAGRFVCAAEARITEPVLHVCLFERPGRWRALAYMAALFGGFLGRLSSYRVIRATTVEVIGCDGPVQGDGDVIATLPVRIAVAPETVPLLMPA